MRFWSLLKFLWFQWGSTRWESRKNLDRKTYIDITKLTPRFLKSGKAEAVYQYRARICKCNKGYSGPFFFDAPFALILSCTKDGKSYIAIACISFSRVGFRTIRIQQIQGRSQDKEKYKEDRLAALKEIKWERLLVRILCEWAVANGLSTVELISCQKSNWYKDRRHEAMFMRYDVTARRMDFVFSSKEQVYKLKLSKLRSLTKTAA